MPDIESPANERIKALVRLRKRRERDATGLFLVEGERELESAMQAHPVAELYVDESSLTSHARKVYSAISESGETSMVTVSTRALERASLRGNPSGFVAVLKQYSTPLAVLPVDEAIVLVVESIEKPGNLGGMIRSANAAGASVLVADPTTDLFNSNVIRASMGTLFTTPVAVASGEEARTWLALNGISIFATTPAATDAIWEVDLAVPCAIVVGSESQGLTEPWLDFRQIRIPMTGTIDSLNASVAAAIGLFEARRQRLSG